MKKFIIPIACLALGLTACHKNALPAADAASDGIMPVEQTPAAYIPKATAFKINGPYADKVAVTVAADGRLSYYPSPSDISASSTPEYIGDGWWLNRQGLSENSVFTSWTFAEYAALPTTPSPSEIKAHIIPGSAVVEFQHLPFTLSQASIPAARTALGIK